MPPSHDRDDVANHRAGGRCNDADALREGWQRAFAVSIEKPLSKQLGFELLEGQLKRPRAARLHGLGNQLKLAAALVDRDASTNQHSEAVGRAKAQQPCVAAEEDDRKLRLAILESEVDVS